MPVRQLSFRRLAILGSGWTFVALGILGLFLPFLQGILFLVIGLYLLSLESARARLLRQRLRRRYPTLDGWLAKAETWIATQRLRLNAWLLRW